MMNQSILKTKTIGQAFSLLLNKQVAKKLLLPSLIVSLIINIFLLNVFNVKGYTIYVNPFAVFAFLFFLSIYIFLFCKFEMRLIFFNDKIVWKKNLIKVLKKEKLLALCVFKMLLETVLIAAVTCCVVLVVLKKIDTIPQLPTKYLYSLAGAMVPYLLIRQSLRIPACVAENEDVGFIEGWRTTSNYGLSYSFIYFVVALMPFMVSALLLSPLGFNLYIYNFVFIFMIFVSIFLQVGLMSYSYFYVKNTD